MEIRTDTANSRDWLEASKEVRIRAYIENYIPTLSIHEKPLSGENFYEALRGISVPLAEKHPAIQEPHLGTEFQAWDVLSDEALTSFEQELS